MRPRRQWPCSRNSRRRRASSLHAPTPRWRWTSPTSKTCGARSARDGDAMPRFAANLSMLYQEMPFLDRFGAAAADGFRGVEYLFPYAFAARDIAARLHDHGLQQVLFNAPPGNWEAGERGIASLAGREEEFRTSVASALEYAQALQCPRVHVMAGLLARDADRAGAGTLYRERLAWAASAAA